MSKFLKHIFFTFLIVGICTNPLRAEVRTSVNETTVQQTPLKEDFSYISPKKYDDDFKERYQTDDYIYDGEKRSKSWLSSLVDWLEETMQDWFNLDTREEASAIVKNLTNAFYIIIIVLVVFFIVRTLMNGEGRWVFGKQSIRHKINFEDVTTDILITDFKKLIEAAMAKGNYRLAIRYQYLNMLKKLNAAEVIAFDPEKTNLDYTYEIKDEAVREQFQYTSYLYNYVWYGEFDIDEAQYQKAQESFHVLLKNVAA
ncbi:DUF4129 domain-containing protein [uncultured Kordia sp.]|uniref:DUF4129 domain-containing protein n=1 Tax=uncultured Kordia sp. TaxID=507699 RepID=UPI00262CC87D|nr:DUF4129 domain-containing protein [uncultured Kordia sp.]